VVDAGCDWASRRSPPDAVEALGVEPGFSESEVSRICADLDAEVDAFRTRPLDSRATPYVLLDAMYCQAAYPRSGRVSGCRPWDVIATGVTVDGHREVLSCNVSDAETWVFWKEFLASLRDGACTGSIGDLRSVKRRTDVVGIFPGANALPRLAGCVLIGAHDEWQCGERRYLSEASMARLTPPEPTILPS
jgi:transposase-like protein